MPNTTPDMLCVGEVVGGQYEVRDRLGANRIGQRFRAHDRRRNVDVELRVVRAHAALLREEAHRIATDHHPSLPEVLGIGMHGEVQYVAMERPQGTTLARHLAARTGVALDEAIALAIELAEALGAVHRLGIAHDVIAPDLVVLRPGGRIVLAGVGVVRAERELAADSPYASRATTPRGRDSFALGVIAFEALTGSVPLFWEPLAMQLARLPATYAPLCAPIASLTGEAEPPPFEDVATTLREARAALRPLSVVIADADRGVRTLLAQVLRQISPGAALRFCGDGRALLELLAVQPADAVFFDPELPRTDVRELCVHLRGQPAAPRTLCATRHLPETGGRLAGLEIASIDITPRMAKPVLAARLRALAQHERPAPRSRRTRPMSAVPRLPARTQPPPLAELVPGMTLAGRYTIEERLGEGGMGNVFAVRHVELGKRFALKVLHPTLAAKPEARQRFLEEAKLASQLSHPNIVSVVDFGHDPERGVFLVMELLTGVTLARYAGRMTIRRTCETIGQLADALEVLHRGGIVHGDVKADNVMMVEEAVGPRRRTMARLIDFGLAHRTSASDAPRPLAGTPEYLAPERAAGGPPSVAADIYAVGVVAYELLAGCVPFQGRVDDVLEAQATAVPPPIAPQRGEPLDPALEALVLRAMHKDPAQRHASASALRYELDNAMRMLGFTRSQRRAGPVEPAFARSLHPQALLHPDGTVELANEAFRALAPDTDELAALVLAAQRNGSPITRITRTGLLALIAPLGSRAHVVLGPAPV